MEDKTMICPRRAMCSVLPYGTPEHDSWRSGKRLWGRWAILTLGLRNWLWNATHKRRQRYGGTKWTAMWDLRPRTCTFCGSAHPEDVFRLLAAGWRARQTDGLGKFYLEPFIGGSPVPCVKVHVQHFDYKQSNRLYDEIRGKKILDGILEGVGGR